MSCNLLPLYVIFGYGSRDMEYMICFYTVNAQIQAIITKIDQKKVNFAPNFTFS